MDTVLNLQDSAIRADTFRDIAYAPLEQPRNFRLRINEQKTIPAQGVKQPEVFPSGTVIRFTSKIYINGTWYFRTAFDANMGYNLAIPASSLVEI